jgi:hypothetical protein
MNQYLHEALLIKNKTEVIKRNTIYIHTFSMPRCLTNSNCARTKSSTDNIGKEEPYGLFVSGLIDEGPLGTYK